MSRKLYGILVMTHYANLIKEFKESGKGLMTYNQYLYCAMLTKVLSPCNFLVFGLGEDSPLWQKINKNGRTVFLEDDTDWIRQFDDQELEIYSVEYNTKAKDHEQIGFDADKLKMNLPETIRETEWDFILVDGPLGHNPPRPYKGPGRMQSIFTAYELLKEGGICIVDDAARHIESTYSCHYFGKENCLLTIEDKVSIFKKEK